MLRNNCVCWVALSLYLNLNFSVSLENSQFQNFQVFSPSDSDRNYDQSESQELGDYSDTIVLPIPTPAKVDIGIRDPGYDFAKNDRDRVTGTGIIYGLNKKKLRPEASEDTSNSGIKINPRGSFGARYRNSQANLEVDVPITWDEASQSVRRPVVFQREAFSGGRNVVSLQQADKSDQIDSLVSDSSDSSFVVTSVDPPPHEKVAKMARFIVHNSNWTSMATMSTRNPTIGYPFANIVSTSDGRLNGNSSGIPYFYMTPLDISAIDLKKSNKASVTMSLAQGEFCKQHSYDPEDPRCARVILVGKVVMAENGTAEAAFAQDALFSRHPDMASWPQDHGWFFAFMKLSNIVILDYFGGAKTVSLEDYFAANL